MTLPKLLLIALLTIPLAEIYLLLQIGSVIGALPTIICVVGTAVLGSWLLRQQGFSTIQRLQQNMAQGILPAREIMEGVVLLLGGSFLLTPGFITDIVGFLCLIPSSRNNIINYLLSKATIFTPTSATSHQTSEQSNVIEGEYKREEDQ